MPRGRVQKREEGERRVGGVLERGEVGDEFVMFLLLMCHNENSSWSEESLTS